MRVTDLRVPLPSTDPDMSTLASFLSRTPTITALELISTSKEGLQTSVLELDPCALPNLTMLQCPPSLIPVLYPTRAITRLSVLDAEDIQRPFPRKPGYLDGLKFCSHAHLQYLEIAMTTYTAVPLRKILPRLDTLCVKFPTAIPSTADISCLIRVFCEEYKEAPAVPHLYLAFPWGLQTAWALDLVLQREMITNNIAPAFGTVTRISFIEELQWSMDAESGRWEPVVLAPHKLGTFLAAPQLIYWLKAMVRDVDRVLSNLFAGRELTYPLGDLLGMPQYFEEMGRMLAKLQWVNDLMTEFLQDNAQ